MEKFYKIVIYFFYISIIAGVVHGECEGVFDCLKAFFTGDIGNETSKDNVLKVFEIPNAHNTFKILSDEEIENASFTLIKQANSLLDSITSGLKFNKNINYRTENFTSFTNWTKNYYTNVSLTKTTKIKTDNHYTQDDNYGNITPLLPFIHNVTTKEYTRQDKEDNLRKYLTHLKYADDEYTEEEYESKNHSDTSDYPVIDYISLYEDTTNELIQESTTTERTSNTRKATIIEKDNTTIRETTTTETNKRLKVLQDFENEIVKVFHSNTSKPLQISNNTETGFDDELKTIFMKKAEKKLNKLNQVLDYYIQERLEDTFMDYPEIEVTDFVTVDPTLETTVTELEITTATDDPGFSFLGQPAEAIHFCKSRRAFSGDRIVGLPADEENYWNGHFYAETFKGLKRVDLVIEFTTKVDVSPIDNAAVKRINNNTFAIKGLNASKSVDFTVKALPGEGFPFLKKITLNGREICKEKRHWTPHLLGTQEQAVISPLISPHKDGPYYCGRSLINFAPLVVKGRPTREGDYPWHVALFIKNIESKNWDYSCGGTIIAGKTVITAAHCVVDRYGNTLDRNRLLVIAGKYKLFEVDSSQKPLRIKDIIVHENYTNTHSHLRNDLALLIAEERLHYDEYIQPICRWNSEQEEKDIIYQEYGTVVGWGSTENDTLSETLLAASMRVIPDSLCLLRRPSFFKRYISPDTFCAGNKNGTSACNGDSGGGLIFPIKELDDRSSWYLRGVVSLGVRRVGGLCDPKQYVVFTDVVKYRHWIDENQEL